MTAFATPTAPPTAPLTTPLTTPPTGAFPLAFDADRPPVPYTIAETGLTEEAILELLLRVLYTRGARDGQDIAETMALPFVLIDDLLLTLQQRQLVAVRGTHGSTRQSYVFELTAAGRERAREALLACQYAGPAPVPLAQYRQWAARQTIAAARGTRAPRVCAVAAPLFARGAIDTLGPAVNSGKSLFLFGAPGNGKTLIAERLAELLGGELYVPYAVEVDGQILVLHDPLYHHALPSEASDPDSHILRPDGGYDRRFARVRRPIVLTGGELTLDQLDLQYDTFTKLYRAPFQLKANGGVLIIDDFGRQRIPPRDLLNRWIVPLEKRVDFLTLHTGGKFPVPFDCLLIFATNLAPNDLVEEAFLRRIHYKLYIDSPDREAYDTIFQHACEARDIPYDATAVARIFATVYDRLPIHPRACHPRDVLDHVLDEARFREVVPALTPALVDAACHAYFLDPSAGGAAHA